MSILNAHNIAQPTLDNIGRRGKKYVLAVGTTLTSNTPQANA
jgi:hypothetical protein